MNLLSIGYLNSLAGDTVETEKAYRESIDLMRELVAREPANSGWQNDLAFSLDKLGELRWRARDIEGAYDPIAEALIFAACWLPANRDVRSGKCGSLEATIGLDN